MEKQAFLKAIKQSRDLLARNRQLCELEVDLTNYENQFWEHINLLWKAILNNYGYEWLQSYLFEKPDKEIEWAWDQNGSPVCRNDEELYEFLVKEKYFNI